MHEPYEILFNFFVTNFQEFQLGACKEGERGHNTGANMKLCYLVDQCTTKNDHHWLVNNHMHLRH